MSLVCVVSKASSSEFVISSFSQLISAPTKNAPIKYNLIFFIRLSLFYLKHLGFLSVVFSHPITVPLAASTHSKGPNSSGNC